MHFFIKKIIDLIVGQAVCVILFVGQCHMLNCDCIGQLDTIRCLLNDILGAAWKGVFRF